MAAEGDGPWNGDMVEHGVVVASTDFVAAGRICTALMGIDPNWMKYLEWCGAAGMGTWDIDNITVNGPALRERGVWSAESVRGRASDTVAFSDAPRPGAFPCPAPGSLKTAELG